MQLRLDIDNRYILFSFIQLQDCIFFSTVHYVLRCIVSVPTNKIYSINNVILYYVVAMKRPQCDNCIQRHILPVRFKSESVSTSKIMATVSINHRNHDSGSCCCITINILSYRYFNIVCKRIGDNHIQVGGVLLKLIFVLNDEQLLNYRNCSVKQTQPLRNNCGAQFGYRLNR